MRLWHRKIDFTPEAGALPVNESDRDELAGNYDWLTAIDDDPSSGLLRFHLTEYVEGHGNMSPKVADWLLERIPIAPRCLLARNHPVFGIQLFLGCAFHGCLS